MIRTNPSETSLGRSKASCAFESHSPKLLVANKLPAVPSTNSFSQVTARGRGVRLNNVKIVAGSTSLILMIPVREAASHSHQIIHHNIGGMNALRLCSAPAPRSLQAFGFHNHASTDRLDRQ